MIIQAQALEIATPEQIMTIFMKNKNSDAAKQSILKFSSRNHRVSKAVINGVIIYALVVLKGKAPVQESYYRKTMETFKSLKLVTAQTIMKYFTEYADQKRQQQYQEDLKRKESENLVKKFNQKFDTSDKADKAIDLVFKRL